MTTQQGIELIVAWLPLVIFIGIFWVFLRMGTRQQKAHIDEVNRINAEHVALNKEMLAELREIRKALQDRKS